MPTSDTDPHPSGDTSPAAAGERRPRFRYGLLAGAALLSMGGIALAQNASLYDPAQLPATKGRVAQYSLTPRGDVDGLILDDGTEVHLPPHLGTQLVFAVKPGDAVTIRGLRARSVPMVQAMQVTNDASNISITDMGPPAGGPPRGPQGGPGRGPDGRGPDGRGPEARGPGAPDAPPPGAMADPGAASPVEATGRVKAQLHGPRGDLNGALLEDGTIIRLPPPEAQRMSAQLAVGQTLFVRGEGLSSPLGKVISARAIGASAAQTVEIAPPPPPPGGPRGLRPNDQNRPPRDAGAPPPANGAPAAPASGTPAAPAR